MSSPIRIQQIELYSSRIRLKEPFVISLGALDFAENTLVIIHTSSGISGIGECSPFRSIHGETIATNMSVGSEIARHLISANPLDIASCHALMSKTIYGNTSIKSAFDCALYDILGKFENLPVYKILGGNHPRVLFTDYTVSLGPVQKMVNDAVQIQQNGFPVIKIKLGGTVDEDIERMKKIREAVGLEIPVRIDANQGWSVKDAEKILNELSTLNIQHCEEPIARWDYMNLPLLRKNSPIPLMADESCCDENDAARLIQLDACDSVNVKLGKSSGIFRAKKIIDLAEKAQLKIQIGGFLESRIGFTAAAHLALSSKNVNYIDFDTPLMFAEDPATGGIEYGLNGSIHTPDKAGFGVWVDENYLQKQSKQIIN